MISKWRARSITCLLAVGLAASAPGGEKQSVVAGGAQVKKISGEFKFTEGPADDGKGSVYFSDIPSNRILQYTVADDKLTTHRENSGGANGLFFDRKGNLLVCEGGSRRLTLTDPQGKLTVLAEKYKGQKFNSPNDLWIDPQGGIYFSDPRYGKRDDMEMQIEGVYYLAPDRQRLIRVIPDMERPNGLIGTPDGKVLFVADQGANRTYRYTINANGALANKKLFATEGSDGVTLDDDGNLYLTTRDGVKVYAPSGKRIETIKIPESPSNVTFGGPENKTLFVTARKGFYSLAMRVSGHAAQMQKPPKDK